MKVSSPLFEKRSHPELNPKLSAWEQLEPYKDDPTIFISFTKIEKLGVNPQTEYDTPAGVYFYPLKATWEQYQMENKKEVPLKNIFPFAAENPYIHIVRANISKCLRTKEYTPEDYKRDFDKLHAFFIPDDNAAYDIGSKFGKFSPNYRLPPATRLIHQVIHFYYSAQREGALRVLGSTIYKKKSIFLTYCLKTILEYTGVVDDYGEGAIHENEPLQAVLFDPRTYRLIKTVHNTPPAEYASSEGQLIKFISQAVLDLGDVVAHQRDYTNQAQYDSRITKYANVKITERVLQMVVAQLPGANPRVIGHLRKHSDEAEGRTLAEFALGWILPIVFEFGNQTNARSIPDSVRFLNQYFDICKIRECTMPNKGLFKYNVLHLAARYSQTNILKLAARIPTAFGTPHLDPELFLDTDYDGSTPYQTLLYQDKAEAEELLRFLKMQRPKIFEEHPEAFEARQ